MARPSDYNLKTAEKLCEYIANGKSLKKACEQKEMPSPATVFKWMRENPEFLKLYEKSTTERTEALAEELLDIVDDGRNDYMEDQYMKGKTPGYQLNGENIQRSRLRADTRKWLMAKMKPKKYGEKLDIKSESEITHKFEDLSDDELERAIQAKQDRAA